jgi:hypothetical protein
MSDKKEKKPGKSPLQRYKDAHTDKPLFYLGKKQDIKEESLEELAEMVDGVWEELAQANVSQPRFFLSQNKPSYLSIKRTVELQPFTPQMLKSLLNDLVYFYFCTRRTDDTGDVKTEYKTRTPPSFFLTQMLNNPLYAFPLPELERIVYAPYFTDTFHLHQTPGYDAKSKTYYHLTDSRLNDLQIPVNPTAEQVTRAKKLIIEETLADFPFAGEAERANAISTMLEPFIRSWFYVTPFRLIESARSGTGKGLLTDALLYPFLGQMPTRLQEARTPDEWQKLLLSILLKIPAVVFFDNIKKPVNDGSLESVLTDKTWGRRLLGTNDSPVLENRATWIFAGNNVRIGEEIARRTVRIRMVAKTANPHQRKEFLHSPLRDWLIAHRRELVEASLLLIQNWIAHDRQVYPDAPVLGSYEDWARIMHGILTVNAIPGFLGNLQDIIDMDKYDEDNIDELLQQLWFKYGEQETFMTKDVYDYLQADDSIPVNLGSGDSRAKLTSLGTILRSNRERAFIVEEDVLKGDLPVKIIRQVWVVFSGSKNNAKQFRFIKLSEQWYAELTEEKSHLLYEIWANECAELAKNKLLLPEEPEIKMTQASAKKDDPF